MQGLMMDFPLTLQHIFRRAEQLFPDREVVSKMPGGAIHRYTYADFAGRVPRLANALAELGVRPGDRVATFAWNHYRHLELYFAIPCMGAVLHTLNVRLFPEQVSYIVNHAEDRVLVVDESLLPLVQNLAPSFKSVEHYIIMSDRGEVETTLSPAHNYEQLLEAAAPSFDWPQLDENQAAGMCYTSGTTGNPKGVAYSHRALFLHSMGSALSDSLGASERDTIFIVVPMFHANAWGLPFTATMVGAKQVYPSSNMQPRDLATLIQDERATIAAGVPTLWIGLFQELQERAYDISSLHTLVVGGSAAPRALIEGFEKRFGVPILHAWGMTETSPLGTVSRLTPRISQADDEARFATRARQGRPVPGVELRIVGDDGAELPWDGQSMGEVQIRGPWVIRSYYNDERSPASFSEDGWLRTGDVAVITPEGYLELKDRTKDLIKSGGEWISSVDLENAIMAHPGVLEAAVVAVRHSKWQERPLAVVVPRPGQSLAREELIDFLRPAVASWWLPDDVVFVESLPKTSVGKFDKKVLRDQFEDYRLPTDTGA